MIQLLVYWAYIFAHGPNCGLPSPRSPHYSLPSPRDLATGSRKHKTADFSPHGRLVVDSTLKIAGLAYCIGIMKQNIISDFTVNCVVRREVLHGSWWGYFHHQCVWFLRLLHIMPCHIRSDVSNYKGMSRTNFVLRALTCTMAA